MLTSSPPIGPISVAHSSPVVGCHAKSVGLRWPYVNSCGLWSSRPTNDCRRGLNRRRGRAVPCRIAVQVLREDAHARVVDGVVLVVIIGRHVDVAVGPEHGAARDRPALDPVVGLEHLANVCELRAFEPPPCECQRRSRVGVALHVVEVDETIRCELRMHGDRLQVGGL